MFADLHYAERPDTDWGPSNDAKSSKLMSDILSWENPDFVVFTGDLITEEFLVAPNGTAYIDMLLQPVVQGNYKWGSTYGNHDSGVLVTREDILATEQQYPNAYTRHGGEGLPGTTNYFVPIYAPQNTSDTTEAETPAVILWFFDSRGGRKPGGTFPATVHDNVVQWFRNESEKIKATWGPVPSYAFFHYPTNEYEHIHNELILHPECTGKREDGVTVQNPDTGLIRALTESGMVKATFVGHNHGNSWCCNYGTMVLCYNRKSGYGGFGGWFGQIRGARVIEMSQSRPWGEDVNYIRLENGSTVDHFPGNL